tara:strand:+ start:17688 stop:18608 length:921 start_codon:yes stop_codon:yes gene_type:complete
MKNYTKLIERKMKKLGLLLMLVSMSSLAQVKGNKNIETRSFKIENVDVIKINFYANITIDQSAKEGMTISMDSNLFDKIDTNVVDGILHLDQLQWVQPSRQVVIKIGAPNLKRVEKGTHRTLTIKNVDNEYLNVMAFVGKVIVQGKTKQFNVGIENGEIDASNLIAKNARVNIWGRGKAKIYAENELFSIIKADGRLDLANTPKKLTGDTKKTASKNKKIDKSDIKWISFKIKNNSWNWNNFFVVGPKQDGSKFGYGFPMMPGKVKQERWTTGTKVYKVSKLGLRKLLVVIKSENEGQTIKLFEKG